VSLGVAALLGVAVFVAACVGRALAWVYSAPPLRLKQNGWFGNAACGFCYESLPWFTGAAALIGGVPDGRTIGIALLYGIGAHGIMTLNDFTSVEGDQVMKLNRCRCSSASMVPQSSPAGHGAAAACRHRAALVLGPAGPCGDRRRLPPAQKR